MPFCYYRNRIWQPLESRVTLPFEQIDERIVKDVLPNIKLSLGAYVLLPNIVHTHGPTKSHPAERFLVLSCLNQGLSFGETGLWLDTCLKEFILTNADGKKRLISGLQSSILHYDLRRPLYVHNRIARYALQIREI